MTSALSAAARRIGFNDSVERDDRIFHVQTEVQVRGSVAVRTTVHEGGKVLFSEVQTVESGGDLLDRLATLAQAQHTECMRRLENTGLG